MQCSDAIRRREVVLGSNACFQELFYISFKSKAHLIQICIGKLGSENYRICIFQGTVTREFYWRCWENKPKTTMRGTWRFRCSPVHHNKYSRNCYHTSLNLRRDCADSISSGKPISSFSGRSKTSTDFPCKCDSYVSSSSS